MTRKHAKNNAQKKNRKEKKRKHADLDLNAILAVSDFPLTPSS